MARDIVPPEIANIAEVLLVWIVIATVFPPDPAGIELGVKVAVAPEGSPVAWNVISAGIVVPPVGAMEKLYVALPPAETA